LLVRIGEQSSAPLDHTLDQLSTALLSDLDSAGDFIVRTLFECVAHLAVKIPIYATICGLINAGKPDFGQEIARTLSSEITIALRVKGSDELNNNHSDDTESDAVPKSTIAHPPNRAAKAIDFNRIRLLLRFAACLYAANLVAVSDVLDVLAFVMELGMNENVAAFIQEHTAYIVISTLIWSANGHLLRDEKENEEVARRVHKMMDILDQFVRERPNIENPPALKPLKKHSNMDFLTEVWTEFAKMHSECKAADSDGEHVMSAQNEEKMEEKKDSQQGDGKADGAMKSESQSGSGDKTARFEVRSIQSPFRSFNRLKKRYSHSLRLRASEFGVEVGSWAGVRVEGLLPVWIEFGVPVLLQKESGVALMEKYVVQSYIHDVLTFFNQDTKLCAEQLILLPSSFEAKHLIVEGIIFKMLTLPQPQHHFIFFAKLIVELFRKETKRWPRVCGPLINLLFHEMADMDTEARDRLIEWFSFHLANFNFQWPWENWSAVCSFPPFCPKTAFIQSVMTRCVHLSYYDRFKATLPRDIVAIVPRKPEGCYKHKDNDVANNLVRMLNQKQSTEDIANHLETHIEPMQMATDMEVAVEVEVDGDSELESKPKPESECKPKLKPTPSMQDLSSLGELKECALSETERLHLAQIEMLFSCMLHVGKSSCTHLLSFLKLYGKKPLKQLILGSPNGFGELVVLRCLLSYWSSSPVRVEIVADKLHAMNYVSPMSVVKFLFLGENLHVLYQQVYWVMAIQAMDRVVKTTQGMQRGIAKFEADLKELNRNLQSDFNDQDATNSTIRTKQKQLEQLSNRLTQTRRKISRVFVLFFSECIKTLNHLMAEQDERTESNVGAHAAAEEEEEAMEMDDDMLMSEQFVVKQETMDKEKEKLAVKEKQEANVNQYIFDIVLGRMVEIARRFLRQIDDETWKVLQDETFANLSPGGDGDSDSKQKGRICDAVKSIVQIKQLLG